MADRLLKYEGKFKQGDRIKAFDFPGDMEAYIIGKITDAGWVHGWPGVKFYTIRITDDSGNTSGRRAGDVGYVPMETNLEELFELKNQHRVTKVDPV
tara:strand:+ start:222 stop:512 length:291 start_codon:yes stop_codon:yes gene_type:complete